MTKVLHAKLASFQPRRFGGVAAALAIGIAATSVAALAGQASTSFQVSITLLPENPASCSANSGAGAPQVTCRPSIVGVSTAGATSTSRDPTILRYRTDTGLRLAGEMIEVGNENYYAWADGERVAWGQTSSRIVVAGGREYVEMTVSW